MPRSFEQQVWGEHRVQRSQRGVSHPKSSPVDAGQGPNADITYAIEADSESVKENLEINRRPGVITTKESLIGLENEVFAFFVRAVDNGSPQRESVVSRLC